MWGCATPSCPLKLAHGTEAAASRPSPHRAQPLGLRPARSAGLGGGSEGWGPESPGSLEEAQRRRWLPEGGVASSRADSVQASPTLQLRLKALQSSWLAWVLAAGSSRRSEQQDLKERSSGKKEVWGERKSFPGSDSRRCTYRVGMIREARSQVSESLFFFFLPLS